MGQAIVRYGLVVVGWIGGMKFTAYLGGFPALSIIPGQFLLKDVVLLGAAVWSAGDALRAARDGGN